MNEQEFLDAKEKLKTLAEQSVLFRAVPENIDRFKKEIDGADHTAGWEKAILLFIELFEEEKRELVPVIDLLKAALADARK